MPILIKLFLPEKPLLRISFHGVITRVDIEQYLRDRPNAAPKDRPMVVMVDMLDVREWDIGIEDRELDSFARGFSRLLVDCEEVIAKILVSTSEKVFGFVRMMYTYIDHQYPVHMFESRSAAEACLREYFPDQAS